MMKLEADLPDDVRETIASCFRELLLNESNGVDNSIPIAKSGSLSSVRRECSCSQLPTRAPVFHSKDSLMQRSANRNRSLQPICPFAKNAEFAQVDLESS